MWSLFSYQIVDAWNQIPDEVVSCVSVENFKTKLDEIIGNVQYS